MHDENEHSEYIRKIKQFEPFIIDAQQRATEMGGLAIKSALAINGASSIAILAFLSQAAAGDTEAGKILAELIFPLQVLVGGVVSAAMASGLGYIRMYFETIVWNRFITKADYAEKLNKAANISLYIAASLVICSYAMFVWGIVDASFRLSKALVAI